MTSLNLHGESPAVRGQGRGCEARLLYSPASLAAAIQRRYERFDADYSSFDKFTMYPKGTDPATPPREVKLPTLIQPSDLWNTEVWESGTKNYALFDVGFNNLREGGELQNRIVLGHINQFPNTPLKIKYGREYKRDEHRIRLFRWSVHRRVLDYYEEEKPYLSADDFWKLYSAAAHTSNSEVLALMPFDPLFTWSNVNYQWVEKNLLATIQITYFGDEDYLRPSLRGVMKAAGFEPDYSNDRYPFEHRLTSAERKKIRYILDTYFDPLHTCEITRYAKFDKLPQEISDRLLFTVFTRALQRGMHNILVSVDPHTLRLFKRYGVKSFLTLPSMTGADEYLGFIDLRSEEFYEIYYRLGESAGRVRGMNMIYPQ